MTRILILCTGNSARSQMAEALLRSYDDSLEVVSAGTEPAAAVHPCAVRAMEEIGLDLTAARPKSVDAFLDRPFDYVVTVCAGADAACPVFRGAVRRRLHFPFDDPAAFQGSPEAVLEQFRRVRDQIGVRFRDFYLGHVRAAVPRLRAARQFDSEAIVSLLDACGLPVEVLAPQFPDGYSVVTASGEVVGVAALEVFGEDALLHSVAVSETYRRSGLGAMLVRDRVASAARSGLRAVWLLTTGAAPFFESLGFSPADRDCAPAPIREAGPASAATLWLPLR